MSEIDRKTAEFSFLSSSFSEHDNLLLSTTPGSVAAAISSALETAAEDHTIPVSDNQQFYNNFQYQQQNSYNNNNHPFNNFGETVKQGLVNPCNSTTTEQQSQQQHTPILFPVAPLRPEQFVESSSVNSNDPYNNQLLLTTCSSVGGGICDRSSNKSILNSVSIAGNHVSSDQQFRSSSACSQFHHHQISATTASSFSSSPSQMADKQAYSSSSGSFNSDNTSSIRDKSDNRETYQVSHCKEKPTSDSREVDSGGGGGCRVFKPSSKIIDLPEKSTASSAASHDHRQLHSSHQHHHHHHHSRSKDSRIPVGIAVAWQRLVTTSSTNPSTTSTMTTKAEISGGHHQNKSKMTSVAGSLPSPTAAKHPSRPSSSSSASSLKNAGRMSSSPALYSSSNTGYSASNPNLTGGLDSNSDILSSSTNHISRPMSACGDAFTGGSGGTHVSFCPSPASPTINRPLPSSSVPPNLGYPTGYSSQYPPHPYHHRTAVSPYLDSYSYAAAVAAQRPFAVPSPLSSPHHQHSSHPNLLAAASNGHHYWGLESPHTPHPHVPLLSPGIPTSPNPSDYLQQISLQQQQMQLSHHHHQQQLLASATNRQMSASPAPPSTTSSSGSPYSPYLQFLYPPQDNSSASLAAVAAAAATMNKSPYYDHYFHQQQQQQQQMLAQTQSGYLQQQSHPNSIPTPPASGNNVGNINSANGTVNNNNGNNNRSGGNSNSGSGSTSGATSSSVSTNNSTHRAIPMQVASPINRTSIPLLSCSPTRAGGLRTPTPTSSSASSTSSSASTAATSATTTTTTVTSSPGSSCSAFSSFSPTNNAVVADATPFSTATTTSQQNSLTSSSSPSSSLGALAGSQELIASCSTSTAAPVTTTTSTTLTSSPSPSLFLLHHQQQHPHLFSSSTAALSPKSLTSSTPSPVTVHDFNSGLNVVISSSAAANNSTTANAANMSAGARKNATPSPISLTPTRALLSPFPPGSPFSPSPIPGNNNNNNSINNNGNYKDQWKEDIYTGTRIKPIPINGHTRETHNSGGGSLTTPPPLSSPLLSLAHHNNMKQNSGKTTSVPTPLSSPSSGQKHDFKRLESLIERRDSESISPLVLYPQHSPATSTTSSLLDYSVDEQQQAKLASLTADEKPGNKPDNVTADQTFCISVKLENLAAAAAIEEADEQQCQQRSNNGNDDSLKVKASNATDDRDSKGGKNICMLKSDTGNRDQLDATSLGESKGGVKVETGSPASNDMVSPPIISCDDANNVITRSPQSTPASNAMAVGESGTAEQSKNQHGGQHAVVGKEDDATNEKVNKTNVPEASNLPVLCPSSGSEGNNLNETIHSNTGDYFQGSLSASSFTKMEQSTKQAGNVKDVSFTSGYSSSQEDNSELLQNQTENLSLGKCEKKAKNDKSLLRIKKKNKEMSAEKKGKASLLSKPDEEKDKAKKKKESGSGSAKVATVATPLQSQPRMEKKGKKGKLEKGQAVSAANKVNANFLSAADKPNKEKKVKGGKKNSDFVDGNNRVKLTKKSATLGVEKVKNKKGLKLQFMDEQKTAGKQDKKNTKTNPTKKNAKINNLQGKEGTNQPASWIAPMSPPMSNNPYQQLVNTSKSGESGGSSNYFISPSDTVLSSGTSFSVSSAQDQHHHHQQPLSVILHQSPSAIHSPSQVTFLITSPTQRTGCGGNTSPLRIPAYIPRSGVATTTAVVASTDDLVGGESYNGPATLTLHRDVDASPQQTYYQPPPAITIQYHHSAPATPLAMEAASPSSLDLLATVAQEFGSREDLGKRMSIDGGSSCNASSIGESPPMSPQKSPAIYHPQHYTNLYSNMPAAPPATQNISKGVKNDILGAIGGSGGGSLLSVVPSPASAAGKRPKSPRKQVKAGKDKKNAKTSNSITLKLSSKKAMMSKVGRKEKRTVSDSAFYSPPVVLLKIPQVPGLCSKKTLQKQQQLQDKAKKTKEKATKGKAGDNGGAEVGAISKSKPKSININNSKYNKDVFGDKGNKNDKPVALNKKGIPGKEDKKGDDDRMGKKKTGKKKNKEAISTSGTSKSLLLLSLPSTSTTKTSPSTDALATVDANNSEKKAKKKARKEKNKSEGGTISSSASGAASVSSLLSPLSILSGANTRTTDQIISTTTSPTKERCSTSFYNPPERISAFAKQVISRRTSALSPTKAPINSSILTCTSPLKQQQKPGSSSTFFPTTEQQQEQNDHQKQKSLPNSPTIKMPQLTPNETPPTTTSSPMNQHSVSAAVAAVASSVVAAMMEKRSEISSSVPKMVNLMRFPNSSKNSSASVSGLLPPPPLVSSVATSSSSQDKQKHCDVVARPLFSSEQDKKKTENIVSRIGNRSPSSGSTGSSSIPKTKTSCKNETMKDNGRLLEKKSKKADEHKNTDNKVKSQRKSSFDQDVNTKKNVKGKKTQSLSSLVDSSVPISKVPKITVTQSTSTHTPTTSSQAFNPVTPSLTEKLSITEGEDSHEHRKSAFASLQVPRGSSTPCSSLASRQASPATNIEEEGETETENENDLNNVWVSDPMFAVSAVKLSNISSAGSSQPTDAEESEDDDIDIIEDNNRKLGKKGEKNKTPKLSLLNSKHKQQKSAPEQVKKSQLKPLVHFKPTGNKKGSRGLKANTKADSVDKSGSVEDIEDEDMVDELDLEVANITTQNAPGRKGKVGGSNPATSSATTAASNSSSTPGSNKRRKPSINRNSSSYITNNSSSTSQSKKHHGLLTKEIMTKVFSRKISPELSEKRGKRRRSSGIRSSTCTEMDADDEEEDHEEDSIETGKGNSNNQQAHQNIAQIAMSAAAAAVVVNSNSGNNNNGQSTTASSSLSASSLALLSLQSPSSSSTTLMKKPKKRSARSSTNSSSASTKSNSRGNRGQSCASVSAVCGVTNTRASAAAAVAASSSVSSGVKDETQVPGKVELNSVEELEDEMRILTDIQGLFYTGRLNALQPPDVYGVTMDNERGAPPHFIFSAEEVLEKCLREKKPQPGVLRPGLRICAYWSPQYSGLYPGRVSSDFSSTFDPEKDLIPIEFDDGDTGMIKLKEIRLLTVNHPVREYDPNPLLTLEKKHRKRRHSSATGTSGGCTGDHEEPDCGEPYCAKIGKLEEDEEDDEDEDDNAGGSGHYQSSSKMLYWTWSGLGYKRPKNKKNKNKEFFHGIQRGDEAINVGDAALFISNGNERPFIGRVERFWEQKGKKMVNVRWFYHPEEVKVSAKKLSSLKHPGALFESPHIDENDVQTIAKKCDVLPFAEFKKRLTSTSSGSQKVAKLSMKNSSKPRDMYYVAGFYDPYTYNLKLKDLK